MMGPMMWRNLFMHTLTLSVLFLFGSITTNKFDAESDVDVVVIYKTQQEATDARKTLYTVKRDPINR